MNHFTDVRVTGMVAQTTKLRPFGIRQSANAAEFYLMILILNSPLKSILDLPVFVYTGPEKDPASVSFTICETCI